MYFLSDASTALFAKQKKQEEKPSTLREKIIGRTNAGKAFRVGAVASAVGLGGLALNATGKNKNYKVKTANGSFLGGQHSVNTKEGNIIDKIKNHYTRDVNDLPLTVKTTITHGKVKHPTTTTDKGKSIIDEDKLKTRKPGTFWEEDYNKDLDLFDTTVRETYSKDKEKGFLGTDRKVRWGRVGKTAGLAGGALALPTGLAYVAGNKKEKEDIERRLSSGSKSASKSLESTRRLINTLHRVSR